MTYMIRSLFLSSKLSKSKVDKLADTQLQFLVIITVGQFTDIALLIKKIGQVVRMVERVAS